MSDLLGVEADLKRALEHMENYKRYVNPPGEILGVERKINDALQSLRGMLTHEWQTPGLPKGFRASWDPKEQCFWLNNDSGSSWRFIAEEDAMIGPCGCEPCVGQTLDVDCEKCGKILRASRAKPTVEGGHLLEEHYTAVLVDEYEIRHAAPVKEVEEELCPECKQMELCYDGNMNMWRPKYKSEGCDTFEPRRDDDGR